MDMCCAETTLLFDPRSAAVPLTDAALGHVAGGFLPVFAGIAIGAAVGALALVIVIAAADFIGQQTSNRRILK
jgi:hypothetical protein